MGSVKWPQLCARSGVTFFLPMDSRDPCKLFALWFDGDIRVLKGMWPRGHVLQSSLPAFSVWHSVSLLQKKCWNPNFFSAIWNIDICAAFCEGFQKQEHSKARPVWELSCCVQGGRMGWWGRAKCIYCCLHLIFCHIEKQLCKEIPNL